MCVCIQCNWQESPKYQAAAAVAAAAAALTAHTTHILTKKQRGKKYARANRNPTELKRGLNGCAHVRQRILVQFVTLLRRSIQSRCVWYVPTSQRKNFEIILVSVLDFVAFFQTNFSRFLCICGVRVFFFWVVRSNVTFLVFSHFVLEKCVLFKIYLFAYHYWYHFVLFANSVWSVVCVIASFLNCRMF